MIEFTNKIESVEQDHGVIYIHLLGLEKYLKVSFNLLIGCQLFLIFRQIVYL